MGNDWIEENIKALKLLYQNCRDEQALSSYIISVIRLLNGMVQIGQGGFHRYERIILGNAVRMFSEHFQEQVKRAINLGYDYREKNDIIVDIEEAVIQMAQVYKNIVDSTANADKRMFMSLAVDTSLYEFSPKLCGLYACMLEKVVQLYDVSATGQQNYAFLIHPTLENNIKAKVLFSKRESSGKVCVVCIPVNILDQTDFVPVVALHEAFHVLTKRERGRKRRAKMFIEVAVVGIKECLFNGVRLDLVVGEVDRRLKKEWMEVWFGKISKELQKRCDEGDDDDRCWYSKKWLNVVYEKMVNGLLSAKMSLLQGGFAESFIQDMYGDFQECVEKYDEMHKCGMKIVNNLNNMIVGSNLYDMLDHYMMILKEAYADIACIITASLEPELYDLAFERSVQFKIKNSFEDWSREMRRMLVYDVIIVHSDDDISKKWKNHKEQKHSMCQNSSTTYYYNENMLKVSRQTGRKYDTIPIIYQKCFDYLAECFEALNMIKEHPDIEAFRGYLQRIVLKQDETFYTMLSGKYEIYNTSGGE